MNWAQWFALVAWQVPLVVVAHQGWRLARWLRHRRVRRLAWELR